jgi:hypothetical protein
MNWLNLIVYTIMVIVGISFWVAIIRKFMEVI